MHYKSYQEMMHANNAFEIPTNGTAEATIVGTTTTHTCDDPTITPSLAAIYNKWWFIPTDMGTMALRLVGYDTLDKEVCRKVAPIRFRMVRDVGRKPQYSCSIISSGPQSAVCVCDIKDLLSVGHSPGCTRK
jgi:hypothetical protein